MRKSYYRRKRNNFLKLSRAEREVIYLFVGTIKFIIMFIIEFAKELYKLSKYIKKIVINFYALRKIGYDLDKILDIVYEISPRQFEIFIAELFRQHGHKVRLTAPTNDYGRDVIVDRDIFIECKHFKKNNYVGREIAQKLLGSMQMLNARKGIIVTTGTFHKNAYEVASMVDNLELMDITDIQKMLLDLKPEQIAKVIMRTKNCA